MSPMAAAILDGRQVRIDEHLSAGIGECDGMLIS